MITLFIILLILSIYSYALYPLILFIISKIFKNEWSQKNDRPFVTIVISAYNEEKIIKEKIINSLDLDYPRDRIEIIVSSDGSTDQTDNIVSGFKNSRLQLQTFPRIGKTACLNKVVPNTKGEIILFTDANSMFPNNLIKKIVRHFSDSQVGLVTGWTKYQEAGGEEETTSVYSKLEKITKNWESQISSCVGADGAVFALRKALYMPLQDHDINDFIIPLNVIYQGKRAIIDPEVFCIEESSDSDEKAYRRQIRITTRSLWAIRRNWFFLNVMKYGWFSFFLLSHKVLRFAVPFFFLGAFLTNILILRDSWLTVFSFFCFIIFIILGALNLRGLLNGKIPSICKYFLVTFSAQFLGCIRMLQGIKDTTWTPQR